MGKILGICTSEKRGTEKHEIQEANLVKDWGIEGDAHGGKWHRQVSLLSFEKIEAFPGKRCRSGLWRIWRESDRRRIRSSGASGGNQIPDRRCGAGADADRKGMHQPRQIYKAEGDCIMPREGVFTEVVKPGYIKVGDEITMIPPKKDRPFTAAVITLSDKGAAGEREDKSGPKIVEMIKAAGYDVKETLLLPDGRTALEKQLIRLADQRQINVIFTTGGTGFAERDVTPEATIAVCDRMANGIADADPQLFHDNHTKSNVQQSGIRYPKKDIDH